LTDQALHSALKPIRPKRRLQRKCCVPLHCLFFAGCFGKCQITRAVEVPEDGTQAALFETRSLRGEVPSRRLEAEDGGGLADATFAVSVLVTSIFFVWLYLRRNEEKRTALLRAIEDALRDAPPEKKEPLFRCFKRVFGDVKPREEEQVPQSGDIQVVQAQVVEPPAAQLQGGQAVVVPPPAVDTQVKKAEAGTDVQVAQTEDNIIQPIPDSLSTMAVPSSIQSDPTVLGSYTGISQCKQCGLSLLSSDTHCSVCGTAR